MRPPREKTSWSTGQWIAAILAVAVHVAFIVFLVVGVTWQNRHPEPVGVELYAPPAKDSPPPRPQPPTPQPAPPKPEPEPPKAEPPKPVAKPEPPQPTKAEIAIREKVELQRKQKEQAERDRKEKERTDAEKKKLEEKRLAEVRDRQSREAAALTAQADREQALAAMAASAAKSKASDDYIRRIQAKIKGNVVVPPDITGNPEAIFDVVQLPTGEIIDATLRKSSGMRAYDEAVQRAIIKSSPLPRPETSDLFQRNLTLKFRPLD